MANVFAPDEQDVYVENDGLYPECSWSHGFLRRIPSLGRSLQREKLKQYNIFYLLRQLCLGMLLILGFWNFISLTWAGLVKLFPHEFVRQIALGFTTPDVSDWSTEGVHPIACHSHNDYRRDIPFRSAVSTGCIGVEADVWHFDEDLFVAHTVFDLERDRSLRNLYINPIFHYLEKRNTPGKIVPRHRGYRGIFFEKPSQTLVLLIDFKTNDESIWDYMTEQLKPLRAAGYLTYFDGNELVTRPVTVVVTGDAPFERVMGNEISRRDIFFDAPLGLLAGPADEGYRYNMTNSYYASMSFRTAVGKLTDNHFSQPQLERIRADIAAAHARGLKVRYWATPDSPPELRNHVWAVLMQEGVDVVNVDDLLEVSKEKWS